MSLCTFHKLGAALSVVFLLAACGGGGGSTPAAAPVTVTPVVVPATLPAGASVSGIAASGAPLLGATVRIVDATGASVSLVDANGNAVGSTTTSTTDGSYRVTLGTTAATLPLLIQARGLDARGNPTVLHSLLAGNSIPAIANITPATEAVVAMVMGKNPLAVFQNAASSASSIALLGTATAISAASDGVKTIIASNLTDAKVSSKTLDFFKDATFSASKTGLDAALEGLRVQEAKDANGKEQLQLANKFLTAGTVEVKVDLATAKTELAKTSGGSVANAIVSTAKTTTSPTATMANLGTLDALTIALNKLIAQGPTDPNGAATDFTGFFPYHPDPNAVPALPNPAVSYLHSAFTDTVILGKLAGYASNNYQLSKFQVGGCADDPISSKGCVRVLVSAAVTNPAGQIVDLLSDAVAYASTNPAIKTVSWIFVGNGLQSDFHIYPTAYTTFGFDGVRAAANTANTGTGVQVSIYSPSGVDPQSGKDRQLLMPSGHVVTFKACTDLELLYQCVSTDPSSLPKGTGELKDSLLEQASFGWMGSVDMTAGAKYQLSVIEAVTDTPKIVNGYLPADVPNDLSSAPFPTLDDASLKSLTPAAIVAGTTLSWKTWAAANPNMTIVLLRSVVTSNTDLPKHKDASLLNPGLTSASLDPIALTASFVPLSYQVWLGAQDSLGRRYYSKYTNAP